MSAAQDLVNQYYNTTVENLKKYNEAKSVLDALYLQAKEYERQIAVHVSNNNESNANGVRGQLAGVNGQIGVQKLKVDQLLDLYNESERIYQQKRTSLLTPAEQESQAASVALQNQSTAAEIAAKKAAAEKAELENQITSFAQKNKQAVSIGIGVLVLVVVVVLYFKFVKKRP